MMLYLEECVSAGAVGPDPKPTPTYFLLLDSVF